jgi:hypothetical protein
MHCQGIACARLFDMGLSLAEGTKQKCFKVTPNDAFISAMER